jgi:hypothetical protein
MIGTLENQLAYLEPPMPVDGQVHTGVIAATTITGSNHPTRPQDQRRSAAADVQ